MQTESFTPTVGEWGTDASATVTITSSTIDGAIAGALQTILDVACGTPPDRRVSADSASISAPIRGQGSDYGEALFELANDLLTQLDTNGSRLTTARLDGVLATDDGGFTAWGYVLGEAGGDRPKLNLSLVGTPVVSQDAERTTITVILSRA